MRGCRQEGGIPKLRLSPTSETAMRHAILILTPPTSPLGMTPSETWQEWNRWVLEVQKALGQQPDILRLGAGVWQFPLSGKVRIFAESLSLANKSPFGYRVLFLDKEPEWTEAGPPVAL